MEILLMNSMDKKKRVGFGFDLKIWVGFEKHPRLITLIAERDIYIPIICCKKDHCNLFIIFEINKKPNTP